MKWQSHTIILEHMMSPNNCYVGLLVNELFHTLKPDLISEKLQITMQSQLIIWTNKTWAMALYWVIWKTTITAYNCQNNPTSSSIHSDGASSKTNEN